MKQLQEQHPVNRVEAKLGWSGYPIYQEDTVVSRIHFAFFAVSLLLLYQDHKQPSKDHHRDQIPCVKTKSFTQSQA